MFYLPEALRPGALEVEGAAYCAEEKKEVSLGAYCAKGLRVVREKNCGYCSIDGFHSRDLQSCGTQMTKAMTAMLVHITKEVH